ncbi:MAG: chaperonin GroEL [SAR202 cluster bacterium]|nr:chaperonin GroEL [SAR202 cluster bacterium]|tara:strand:+ start:537 stop:2129 length:1593 start_codon:yes stop_codon:yes gene_type:complete
MPKQFQYDEDARKELMNGIDTLAHAVGVTLGPAGRNVVLDKGFGPPQICSDGVTIAKEIELSEPFPNMGAQLVKEAASKTNDDVGDGTTTSTVMAQGLLREGFKNVAAGANPMAVKRGIERAVETARDEIQDMARTVEGREQIAQVAILAAHDQEMGDIVADILDNVGGKGVVTVEESNTMGYEVDYVEGMQIDRGYLSPYFSTDQEKMIAELENPYILITSEKISTVAELVPILERVTTVSKNFLVIAEDIDGEALATLVVNKLKGNLSCLAVKAPGFGDRRKDMLEDMAILFGANVISTDSGRTLDSVSIDDLGQARRVISNKDDTTFVDGRGNEVDIHARVGQIRQQADETTSDYDREKLEERAAKLSGGVSVLRVGAATEIELREKKQRLEDALSATRAAMDEGIVPGGGVALLRATQRAAAKIDAAGDEQTGVNMLSIAAAVPIRLIADNAGLGGEVVFHRVSQGEDDFGFDADNAEYGSMFEMGIVDPAKVTRSALENAASVAGMVLTTHSLITDAVPEEDSDE